MKVVDLYFRCQVRHLIGADRTSGGRLCFVFCILLLSGTIIWSYWHSMIGLAETWRKSDDYSAGQLVPLVAVFFLWRDRKTLREQTLAPRWWGGISLLVFAQAGRILGLLFIRQSMEWYTLIIVAAGLVVMIAGWQFFRHVSWILLFLFLMFPLPVTIHNAVAGPLQRMATTGSVVLLEAVGASVDQQGNVVMLGEKTPMAVAEACSGLRMLTAFIIVAAFIAYMVKRPRWQKGILLVSSIPVAVICNIVRIFATGLLMMHISSEVGEKFFHDFAGLVMMPIAVLLLFGELWLMNKIVVPDSAQGPAGAQAKSVVRRRKGASQEMPDCA